jgi:hypothetical protein
MTENARWYPSHAQLKDPQTTERSFRQVLDMFYQLQDSHAALQEKIGKQSSQSTSTPTNTASVTNMLGLPVHPADTTQLADGTKLTYVAAKRRFEFL